MSVHDEDDFARVYDEDGMMTIRRGDLRALLDLATQSMDFASGLMNDEDVEILRGIAPLLDIDPIVVTPSTHRCKYTAHDYVLSPRVTRAGYYSATCRNCYSVEQRGFGGAVIL